jgi:precorrin-6A/cobalt-precorrin-6A reductase
VWLTSGRQGLETFATLDAWFLIRCVDPPAAALPRHHELLLDRGPYALDGERRLLADHGIDLLVTKDSGGSLTEAKLAATRECQVPVIVVRRPPRPAAATVTTVAEATAWAAAQAAG